MYTLLVTGDVPGAATYFNPLLQQTIVPCTSGTRPSSPPNGMHVYETDTSRLMKWNSTLAAWEPVASSRTTSYTPILTGTGGNPALGTGSSSKAWYAYLPGPSVVYNFHILFGSTGVTTGSGFYNVSLPVTSGSPYATGNIAHGSIMLADSSSSGFRTGTIFIGQGATTLGMLAESSAIVGSASPWTWAAGDYISGTVTYPI